MPWYAVVSLAVDARWSSARASGSPSGEAVRAHAGGHSPIAAGIEDGAGREQRRDGGCSPARHRAEPAGLPVEGLTKASGRPADTDWTPSTAGRVSTGSSCIVSGRVAAVSAGYTVDTTSEPA